MSIYFYTIVENNKEYRYITNISGRNKVSKELNVDIKQIRLGASSTLTDYEIKKENVNEN